MMPPVACSFPRPLRESKCRRDKGLALRCAARQRISQARPKPRGASSFCCGAGPRVVESPLNACFESTSVNTFCAASWLPLPPPRFGKAATFAIRGPWMYFAGCSPWAHCPSTHITVLSSSSPFILACLQGARDQSAAAYSWCLAPDSTEATFGCGVVRLVKCLFT